MKEFLGIGAKLIVAPTFGRKRTIELKRTLIKVSLRKVHDISWDGLELILPSLNSEDFHIQLTQDGTYEIIGENGFFSIGPLSLKHCHINPNLEVRFGYNKLTFVKNYCLEKEDREIFNSLDQRKVDSLLPIYLEGETGTGKSHMAKEIHAISKRQGPFVSINISSFSPSLIESELFGHVKGAFTGAINDKKGAFEQAHRGTLFIDEIDSLSKELQVKLLLFLDSFEIRPVGGAIVKNVDVKIIFASGKKLEQLVRSGEFRSDLFFRIRSGFSECLSPLRSCQKLKKRMLKKLSSQLDVELCLKLEKYYLSYDWPGNIREMKGELERKKVLSNGNYLVKDESDNLFNVFPFQNDSEESLTLDELKDKYVLFTYQKFDQKVSLVSKALNVSPNTVRKIVANHQSCYESEHHQFRLSS